MSSRSVENHGLDHVRATTTVRLWAGARAAAGVDELALTEVSTVDQAVAALGAKVPDLVPILAVSTLLIDGRRVESGAAIEPGDVLEVLPPFAGG